MKNNLPPALAADLDRKWHSLQEALDAAQTALPDEPDLIERIRYSFALSDFVANTCIRNPLLLVDLIESGDFQGRYLPETYRKKTARLLSQVDATHSLTQVLRHFRQREMIRIAVRDLCEVADVFETMKDLSALADSVIDAALGLLYQHHCAEHGTPVGKAGTPLQPVVIGLGKLGGEELNFSSDVDLIFAYPENGRTEGAKVALSNEEFFARLFRNLHRVLAKRTEDGFVFRVDLRLRPFGENGPMAMSFDSMDNYYQMQGREWERYAWIKARVVAGDSLAGARLLERLNPFVYRRYLDYGAFESLRDMKHNIEREVNRRGFKDNIKLGRGGIREIEFFGQVFQLIRGGVSALLQERSILKVLRSLSDENLIPQEICSDLSRAYAFLRKLEHRLQEFDDQQTHQLPQNSNEKMRLALSMGYADTRDFMQQLDGHREAVHKQFNLLLQSEDVDKPSDQNEKILLSIWHGALEPGASAQHLEAIGYPDPADVQQALERFRGELKSSNLGPEGRRRLDRLMPMLLKRAGQCEAPLTTLKRIIDLLKAIEGRAAYLALLVENPHSLTQLVKLTEASSLIATFLSRHPVLLDELLDPRSLYAPPKRHELEGELKMKLGRLSDDFENQMDTLRVFKQVNVLRVAAADVTEVLPLMRVSDHLSDIAEVVLNEVLELAWRHLGKKHGEPLCELDGRPCDKGFAVVAYGKLGGLELGYGSDLDLVFLHAGTSGQTRGAHHPIDNHHYFARLGQRVVHILTAHTRAGILYETDMRLRPSGISGVLVSHIDGFRDYQLKDAWTWEHQALIRARPVGGNPILQKKFKQVRQEVLSRPRDPDQLRREVVDMRQKMQRELLKPEAGVFDLKQDTGGIVDIEFLVQYLVLRHAHRHKALLEWTDNVRLIQTLIETAVLDEFDAYLLKHAYLIYRALAHKLSLQEKPASVPAEKLKTLREKVTELWHIHLG